MLDEIVDKYKKTYHRIIKLKPADVKMDTYIDYDVDHNGKDLDSKLEIILEYQNAKIIFNISPNQSDESDEVFLMKKVKITLPQTYTISNIK